MGIVRNAVLFDSFVLRDGRKIGSAKQWVEVCGESGMQDVDAAVVRSTSAIQNCQTNLTVSEGFLMSE